MDDNQQMQQPAPTTPQGPKSKMWTWVIVVVVIVVIAVVIWLVAK